MKNRKTSFKKGAVIHIYQNTINRGLIFYDVLDFLVFFTIFCIEGKKYKVRVIGLCLMVDHIHVLIQAESRSEMEGFVREYTKKYARKFNLDVSREGQLFTRPFGFATKRDEKTARTAIAYLYNNPVEKGLVAKAMEYRWNFLAYANCPTPFSDTLRLRSASRRLRSALDEVHSQYSSGLPLSFPMLRRLVKKLDKNEQAQLFDSVITLYNIIDYEECISYYGDFNKMVLAFDSNTGSEYDMKEDMSIKTDVPYRKLVRAVKKMGFEDNPKRVVSLDADSKIKLYKQLIMIPDVFSFHLKKFLHLI